MRRAVGIKRGLVLAVALVAVSSAERQCDAASAPDAATGTVTATANSSALRTHHGRSRSRGNDGGKAGARKKLRPGKVAIQPFDGEGTESLRGLVVRIVRGRGFRPMTSLPRYEGTGQYPLLARDHHLAAFVTADLEERGRWQRITFLVWNGVNGSVVGRWTASAPAPVLARAVGRGFWQHLGPAIRKAEAPPLPLDYDPAPPMRIDASSPNDDRQLAKRQ